MKKSIFLVLITLALSAVFSGCERNDYQHPMHRSN